MCSESARNTGVPRATRRRNASTLSAIGIPIATSGKSSVTAAVPLRFSSSETAASTSPRKWLPVSPMKMRAGGKLYLRNPRLAPIRSEQKNMT